MFLGEAIGFVEKLRYILGETSGTYCFCTLFNEHSFSTSVTLHISISHDTPSRCALGGILVFVATLFLKEHVVEGLRTFPIHLFHLQRKNLCVI